MVYRLQKWMDSVPGQTFLNYAYSWGASVVILGTLFKLTHIPGANFMLFLGMGTEVVVFFLSAFDRPFDKTTIGMDLATHVEDDEAVEELSEDLGEKEPEEEEQEPQSQGIAAGGTIILSGGGMPGGGMAGGEGVAATGGEGQLGTGMQTSGVVGGVAYVGQPSITSEVADATGAYIEELQKLTEILEKVGEQSQRIATDSEEMENLNRTLTGISRIYEMQLKSASSQIGTIEEINAQTRRMAEQIEQLNQIYARMIEAMTTNMGMKPGM